MRKKRSRQNAIKEIILKHAIKTQEELVNELMIAGWNVTQATVSRDIKELQLIKLPLDNGNYKYALPIERSIEPLNKLSQYLADNYINMVLAQHLLVLKTLPGTANAIGVLIDQLNWPEIVGTVCGDDTCLIITQDNEQCKIIEDKILALLQ